MIHARVIVIGGGLAGLSAALYLARAKRDTLLIDSGKSMARWEPKVENYLGFPAGINGALLLERGRRQLRRYKVPFKHDFIKSAKAQKNRFVVYGAHNAYSCERLLLATGIFHVPPEIPGVSQCLGHSMFFCKDCDGVRVQGKRLAIYGWADEAAEYALAMLAYTKELGIVTDGRKPRWNRRLAKLLRARGIPANKEPITSLRRSGTRLKALVFEHGPALPVDALFTTRGDVVFNGLAKALGARLDKEGQVVTDVCMRTSVKGLYAAGCVTPANCQMIIAAGQGATAAQTINRDIFEEDLGID